jgi:transcriptional regulator with XRE-family HTH domain
MNSFLFIVAPLFETSYDIVAYRIVKCQRGSMKNNLRQFRKARGISQLRLAMATGIAPCEISRIENDWIVPYPGWRKRLARALGVSEAVLFPPKDATNGD